MFDPLGMHGRKLLLELIGNKAEHEAGPGVVAQPALVGGAHVPGTLELPVTVAGGLKRTIGAYGIDQCGVPAIFVP